MKPHIRRMDNAYWCYDGNEVGKGITPLMAYTDFLWWVERRRVDAQLNSDIREECFRASDDKKPADNQTGLGWLVIFTAAFLGSLAVEIASLLP